MWLELKNEDFILKKKKKVNGSKMGKNCKKQKFQIILAKIQSLSKIHKNFKKKN
jgi:hypothetical protein